MNFDKETIIAIAICLVVLFGWTPVCRYMGWLPEPATTQQQTQPTPTPSSTPTTTIPEKVSSTEIKPRSATRTNVQTTEEVRTVATREIVRLPFQTISNQFLTLTFSPSDGNLRSVKLENYLNDKRSEKLRLDANIPPGALIPFAANEWATVAIIDNSRTSAESYQLIRKMSLPNGNVFLLAQYWQFAEDYVVDYKINIQNLGKTELTLTDVTIFSNGLPPFSKLAGDKVKRETHALDYLTEDNKFHELNITDPPESFLHPSGAKTLWAGVSNKYFAVILYPEKPFDAIVPQRIEVEENEIMPPGFWDRMFGRPGRRQSYYLATVGGKYHELTVAPDTELSLSFKYYSGPKIIANLRNFAPSASKIMHLGWGPLDWLARILLRSLIFLKSICGSYGWGIIILTIIVRMLFWPITHKATSSMKKMQKLQPRIKDIREHYKSDPKIMNAKVMELYREEKVNPLGGCLPILLQIPVFIALYQTLDGVVELRQVSFWWAADLAKPDYVGSIFGIAIHPLVIIMSALMILQQKLTPAAMEPAQQKMMMAMPLLMLFLLYDLPAGLTLYWTVSQIFSIIQLLVQQKMNKDEVPKIPGNKKAKLPV